MDDVRAVGNPDQTAAAVLKPDLSLLEAIERIEVIRGPLSSCMVLMPSEGH